MSLTPFVHLDGEIQGCASGDVVPLGDGERHHLARVLRLAPGATIEVSDGRGGMVPAVLGDGAVRLTGSVTYEPVPRPKLYVLQGLPKGRKMDEVVRQSTELGVDGVVPVVAERSVVRLEGERAVAAVRRWRAVARAAAEQSRRPWRPTVADVTSLSELPSRWRTASGGERALFVAHPGERGLPGALERRREAGSRHVSDLASVGVAIGPEGGWSEHELVSLRSWGAELVGLGAGVMRTEHAAAAALAALCALLGRWE